MCRRKILERAGKEQKITITSKSKLSEDEIDRAVQEAEQFAESDKKRKELVDAKNEADATVFQTEKLLKDAGDKIGDDDKARIEEKLGRLRTLTDGVSIDNVTESDAEAMKQAAAELMEVVHEISTKMYEQAGGEQGADYTQTEYTEPGSENGDINGEYKEYNS